MPSQHALVFIDHDHARVFLVDRADPKGASLKQHAHHHASIKHKSDGKAQHDHRLFDDLIKEVQGIEEILVVGPGTAKKELVHHIEAHAKPLSAKIVGVEAVDHPTDPQLVALAKKKFKGIDLWR
jgi:stalled ribosome rescue protein Dom34